MTRNWLCKIGSHRWRDWAVNSIIEPLPIQRCERCGLGRKFLTCGTEIRYSREQMIEAEEELARRQPSRLGVVPAPEVEG